MAWQTTVRETLLEPFLPPPVVKFLQETANPQLASWGLGDEGVVTILTTIMAAWITFSLLKLFVLGSGSGKAIVEDDDDDNNNQGAIRKRRQRPFDSTVVLVGPPNAGKTRLFYQFCNPNKQQAPLLALTSIKPNIAVNPNNQVRYMDLPGHSVTGNNNSLLAAAFQDQKKPTRIVLIMDATQPVAAAALILYQLAELANNGNNKATTTITLVCHKQDYPKAKNPRRMAIQLRTELERLLSVRQPSWWSKEELESLLENTQQLPNLELQFIATSCETHTGKNPNQLTKLQWYCETGDWVDDKDAGVPTAQSK